MKDFSITTYHELLKSLKKQDYSFQTFSQFIEQPNEKVVILRHDVDQRPNYALILANIQSKLDIHGTFFFRATPRSWNEKIIKDISTMGHEIGYHYENMDTCNGNMDKAFEDFKLNLEKFRRIAEVKTICMHGSPYSKYDNKDLWKKYNYKNFGITGEPYLDIDFSKVFYLTDTGRCWNGYKKSIRDKIPVFQEQWESMGLVFRSTFDIIMASNKDLLPQQIMITFHPQRWTDRWYPWIKELVMQKTKNQIKFLLSNSKLS